MAVVLAREFADAVALAARLAAVEPAPAYPIMAKAGHALYLEQSERVNAILSGFVRQS